MVSQLHGISGAAAHLSTENAFVACSLSPVDFDRLQLELLDCWMENGFTTLYRTCDQNSCNIAQFDLCACEGDNCSLSSRFKIDAVISFSFCRDYVRLFVDRCSQGFSVFNSNTITSFFRITWYLICEIVISNWRRNSRLYCKFMIEKLYNQNRIKFF